MLGYEKTARRNTINLEKQATLLPVSPKESSLAHLLNILPSVAGNDAAV